MTNEFQLRALYEVLYNNLLLPRPHEINREEERKTFDGSTESLVLSHKDNQISCDQFFCLFETQIAEIIEKSKDLPID